MKIPNNIFSLQSKIFCLIVPKNLSTYFNSMRIVIVQDRQRRVFI